MPTTGSLLMVRFKIGEKSFLAFRKVQLDETEHWRYSIFPNLKSVHASACASFTAPLASTSRKRLIS